MVGRIYKIDDLTLLNTKYLISGPHGFREDDYFLFFFFSIISLRELMSPGVLPIWTPGE